MLGSLLSSLIKLSMTMLNKQRLSGSPCLTPLLMGIGADVLPLILTVVVEVLIVVRMKSTDAVDIPVDRSA